MVLSSADTDWSNGAKADPWRYNSARWSYYKDIRRSPIVDQARDRGVNPAHCSGAQCGVQLDAAEIDVSVRWRVSV